MSEVDRSAPEATTGWPPRRVAVAILATVGSSTPLYTRMTPVLWWNYSIRAATAVLSGLVTATYVRGPQDSRVNSGVRAASGGLLAAFAVGCPICNKLVVAAVGSPAR